MTYEYFMQLLKHDVYNRFELILDYDEFKLYRDKDQDRYYYIDEDDKSLCEMEKIAILEYNVCNDLKDTYALYSLFDSDLCGEQVLDDKILYLWFKIKENDYVYLAR